MTLQELKDARYIEVDLRTNELITSGFEFGGHTFSMSLTAQINWSNFPVLPEQLFPLSIADIDENIYILSFENKMNFYFAALGHKNTHLQSGNNLKAAIKAATTIEEVNQIIDER